MSILVSFGIVAVVSTSLWIIAEYKLFKEKEKNAELEYDYTRLKDNHLQVCYELKRLQKDQESLKEQLRNLFGF